MLDVTGANVNNLHKVGKHWFWIVDEISPAPLSIRMIQSAVAKHFGLTIHDLVSEVRTRKEVKARHIAMYLSRCLTRRPHDFIGVQFGRADHSMSIYACKKINRLLGTSPKTAQAIEDIKSKLLGGHND
jgi:chromosomal replication initiator protein